MSEYADSAATGEDFREVLEQTSGQDFSAFFDQWYYGEGYPIIDVDIIKTKYSDSLNLVVTQQTSRPSVTPFFKMHTEYLIDYLGGDTLIRTFQEQPVDTFTIYMPNRVTSIEIDPNNWIVNKGNSLKLYDDDKKWAIYPIPAKDNLHIKPLLDENPGDIYVNFYNTRGAKVKAFNFKSDDDITIPCSNIPPGVYFIELITENQRTSQKIIIEN